MDDPEPLLNNILLNTIFNPITINSVISFVILIVLLICSALVSGSEVAYFSLSPDDLDKINNTKSKSNEAIKTLIKQPKRLLATILISNNFINVAIVILSAFLVNDLINFTTLPNWAAFTFEVIVITFILLLIGEVLPKVYATKKGLYLASFMALPILFLKTITKPLSNILIGSTRIIDKRIKKQDRDFSAEEISQAIDLTEDIDEQDDEHKILKGIMRFGDTSVKQIMKARVDIVAIEKNTPFDELISIILDSGFSRIPVYDDSLDNILGVLYIKDVLPYIQHTNSFNWQQLIRNPFFVPENKKLDDLLKEFQHKKVHLSIVVDEYGGTSGIVTLEDVLEEIVGEISDEFDDDNIAYSKLDENNYIFEGKTPLNDFCKIIDVIDDDFFEEVKKDADSLAGLVIELAGKIPKKNETIKFKQFTFTVESADKRRVKQIKVSIEPELKPAVDDDE